MREARLKAIILLGNVLRGSAGCWALRLAARVGGGACGPGLLLALRSRHPQRPAEVRSPERRPAPAPAPAPATPRQTPGLGSLRRLVFPACTGPLRGEAVPGTPSASLLSGGCRGALALRWHCGPPRSRGSCRCASQGTLRRLPCSRPHSARSPCRAWVPQPEDGLSPALPWRLPHEPWTLTWPGPSVGNGSLRLAWAGRLVSADAGAPRGRPSILRRDWAAKGSWRPLSLHERVQLLVEWS